MKPLLLTAALLLPMALSGAALAQAPAAAPEPAIIVSAAQIQALEAQAKAALKPGQPFSSVNIIRLRPYSLGLEFRTPDAPPTVHLTDAEFMYVIDGEGSVTTGGALVDAKETSPGNLAGTSIKGGVVNHMAKGDFIIVPQGTPHQGLAGPGGLFVLATLHIPRPVPAGK